MLTDYLSCYKLYNKFNPFHEDESSPKLKLVHNTIENCLSR